MAKPHFNPAASTKLMNAFPVCGDKIANFSFKRTHERRLTQTFCGRRLKHRKAIPAVAIAMFVAVSAEAAIFGSKMLEIDFTDVADARAKATWSEPEKLTVSTKGLGWDGEAASSRDGWIQSDSLALGLSWRPPQGVSVRVSVYPKPTEFVRNSGQKSTPYAGDVYIRYSPDLLHWSTWQVLQTGEPQSDTEKQNPGRHFSGTVRVPYSERAEYGKLISEYSTLDVPWKSDEDAAVRWILEQEPDFFARQLPFIGYVQFRYEARFYGGQRIRSFKAEVSYGMGGLHLAPKDENVYEQRDAKPWSFKAGNVEKEAEPESGPILK